MLNGSRKTSLTDPCAGDLGLRRRSAMRICMVLHPLANASVKLKPVHFKPPLQSPPRNPEPLRGPQLVPMRRLQRSDNRLAFGLINRRKPLQVPPEAFRRRLRKPALVQMQVLREV